MRLGRGSRIEISLIRLVSSSLRGLSRNQRLAGGAAACDGDAADRTCVTGWWLPAAGPAWHQAGSWGLNAHGILGRALTMAPRISLLQQQELIILNKSWSLTPWTENGLIWICNFFLPKECRQLNWNHLRNWRVKDFGKFSNFEILYLSYVAKSCALDTSALLPTRDWALLLFITGLPVPGESSKKNLNPIRIFIFW